MRTLRAEQLSVRSPIAAFLVLFLALAGAFPLFAQEAAVDPDEIAARFSLPRVTSAEEFAKVARTLHPETPYSLPHAMFFIDRKEGNRIYYADSNRYRFHKDFLLATYLVPRGADVFGPIYIDEDRRFIVGTVAFQRTVDKYTWEIWEGDMATAEHLKTAHEVINRTFFTEVA
ncbi:MAG TPA: hypothetical protein DEP46_01270, partial [Blastocatellia bacterium]|nr:hypothetical protein [Blastocatellia bacterium]